MEQEIAVEKIYQKKTQLEHILLRPDTYVGSVETTDAQLWILEDGSEQFVSKKIEYVPAFYKIFDEILVNAADNYQRDKSMNTIKVTIDPENCYVSVWNNGKGIPVQIHQEHGIYVPEMIFGHLLTSSNYDDTQKKVTGGRNGYGAKLTNIFSKKFVVETADNRNKKYFKMTWRDNMSNCSAPEIKEHRGTDFTCVTFYPDLKRFNMRGFDDDIVALMRKRVYDLAGVISPTVKVFLNEKQIGIKGFQKYVDLYFPKNVEHPVIVEKQPEGSRWEVIVSISDGQFQQVSFVNSICTSRGGTHVTYITEQITDKLIETIKKKHKNLNIKPFQIRNHLWVFINCLIENPAFDSQTKETMTLKQSQFGSKCELSEKFLKDILKSGVIDSIVLQAQAKETLKLQKTLKAGKSSRLLGIAKLDDANDAGTRLSEGCTLILTEGDSAKSLACAGIEVVGRDKYGVFPLRGKFLNVRDTSSKQIMENQEIQNLIKIIGLQVGKKYEDLRSLRYGSIMIMADQDPDGSHIKGLIINFINHFWPTLFKHPGFLKEFITPLIKATKGNQTKIFFSMHEFMNWKENPANQAHLWKIKYYKGLGTSTDTEAKEYFENINRHQITFKYQGPSCDEAVDLAFNKKKADARKDWLANYSADDLPDNTQTRLTYTDFVHKELIQFSFYDNARSIPSVADGFKPGQRKVLFACFKRNLKGEIKVAQLSGYVAEHSAYHHGEQSLAQTIIGMAQNFVGANNINLLMPNGQFGSRNNGGKDAASARYLFTNLNKVTRFLFPEPDDHLLHYLDDDGQLVEPKWYIPIIPMVLVNGAEGIGTGWSTSIPCYNPREIVDSIRAKLKGEDFKNLVPWFKGFTGDITEASKSGYNIEGKVNIIDDDTIEITELPIGKWTKDYKAFLESMVNPSEGGEPEIEDIREYHANNRVHFVVKMVEGKLAPLANAPGGLMKKFKLSTTMQISNMVAFDFEGKIKRYASTTHILEDFYDTRLKYYQKRKDYLASRIQRDLEILDNKKRFIIEVVTKQILIMNVKRKDIIAELVRRGYKKLSEMTKIKSTKKIQDTEIRDHDEQQQDADDLEKDIEKDVAAKEYDYLLRMPLWSLTYERVEAIKKEFENKVEELERLLKTKIEDMWLDDLDNFLVALDEYEDWEEKARLKGPKAKEAKISRKQTNLKIRSAAEGNSEDTTAKKPRAASGGAKRSKKTEKADNASGSEDEFKPTSKKKATKKDSMEIEGDGEKAKKPKKEKKEKKEKDDADPAPKRKKKDIADFFKPKTETKENTESEKKTSEPEKKTTLSEKIEEVKREENTNPIFKYLDNFLQKRSPGKAQPSTGLTFEQRLKQRLMTGNFL